MKRKRKRKRSKFLMVEEKGFLYIIDEPIEIGKDIYQHPRTTMDKNAEFLTTRPLRVKLLCEL